MTAAPPGERVLEEEQRGEILPAESELVGERAGIPSNMEGAVKGDSCILGLGRKQKPSCGEKS